MGTRNGLARAWWIYGWLVCHLVFWGARVGEAFSGTGALLLWGGVLVGTFLVSRLVLVGALFCLYCRFIGEKILRVHTDPTWWPPHLQEEA